MMEHFLRIEGALLMLLALAHIPFPRYFRWREEMASCSLFTRQVLHVHCFFIALGVFLMGLLCVTSAYELTGTPLGRNICAGFCFFWLCRLLVQFFGYSSELWRGKRFETTVHVLFSLLWIVLTVTFGIVAFFPPLR